MGKERSERRKIKFLIEKDYNNIKDLLKEEMQNAKIELKLINNISIDNNSEVIEDKTNEITIRYKLENISEKEDGIRLFGSKFFLRNKNKEIKLIIEN